MFRRITKVTDIKEKINIEYEEKYKEDSYEEDDDEDSDSSEKSDDINIKKLNLKEKTEDKIEKISDTQDNQQNQHGQQSHPLLDTAAILEQFKIMEEMKKSIITPLERIQKDIAETKDSNYAQYKFKLLIFTLLYQNGSYKDMSVFSDYMYFRRIGFTPERLSSISDEEFGRLNVKKVLNKTKPNTKLRQIAEKIHLDYNGEVPENSSELSALLVDSKRGHCQKTIESIMNTFKDKEETQEKISVTHDVSRISERLRWTDGNRRAVVKTTLHEKFPESMWSRVNPVLTAFAQDLCQMEKPFCLRCPFTKNCKYFNRNLNKIDEDNFSARYRNSGLAEYIKKLRNMKTEHKGVEGEEVEEGAEGEEGAKGKEGKIEKKAEKSSRKKLKPIIRKASQTLELNQGFSPRKHKKISNKK